LLAAVADGMGGHEFGEVASYLVMRYLLSEWKRRKMKLANSNEIMLFLREVIMRANAHLYHVNHELQIRWCMGTTLSLGFFWGNRLTIAQIGDSRVYRLRHGKLQQLTRDQSWREEMVANGIMSEEDAANHPLSNMLTNCVGAVRNVNIEFSQHKVSPGDRYLICSDGLSGMVPDNAIAKIFSDARHPGEAVNELIKSALQGGGGDNVTVVCVFLSS
ncbi:MAG: serine/threonine-protein phosphatase, partial [Lentisphaerae bacterium]